MATLTDPTALPLGRAGSTYSDPSQWSPSTLPTGITPPSGYKLTDWANVIQGMPDYMNWKLSAGERQDAAAATRRAALQALAMRYGGLPENFKDVYGDITPDVLTNARANPESVNARMTHAYEQSRQDMMRSLAARGALQSGDYGYGTGQLDYQQSADAYDNAIEFLNAGQGTINDYSGTLAQLQAEQMQAIQDAAQGAYDAGYRDPNYDLYQDPSGAYSGSSGVTQTPSAGTTGTAQMSDPFTPYVPPSPGPWRDVPYPPGDYRQIWTSGASPRTFQQ